MIALSVGVTLTLSATRTSPATTQQATPPTDTTATRPQPSTTQPRPSPSEARADDASAKVQARTLQTAIETAATDNNGSYKGVTLESLEKIEPTLTEHGLQATPEVISSGDNEYKVKSTDAVTGDWFTIARSTEGVVTRECGTQETGGCPAGGSW